MRTTHTHTRTQTLEQIQTTLPTLTSLIPTSHTHNAQLFIGLDFKHNFNNVIVSQSKQINFKAVKIVQKLLQYAILKHENPKKRLKTKKIKRKITHNYGKHI